VRVELLLVEECANADAARMLLAQAVERTGLDIVVAERVGDHVSPTFAVDGRDVMTGEPAVTGVQACRVELPSVAALAEALRRANARQPDVDLDRPNDAES
jgi:hypothetical protein